MKTDRTVQFLTVMPKVSFLHFSVPVVEHLQMLHRCGLCFEVASWRKLCKEGLDARLSAVQESCVSQNGLWVTPSWTAEDGWVPWWLSGEEPPANAGDTGSVPGSGRSPGGGSGNPLQCSCLEKSMDSGAWRATSPWRPKESNTTEQLNVHKDSRTPGDWTKLPGGRSYYLTEFNFIPSEGETWEFSFKCYTRVRFSTFESLHSLPGSRRLSQQWPSKALALAEALGAPSLANYSPAPPALCFPSGPVLTWTALSSSPHGSHCPLSSLLSYHLLQEATPTPLCSRDELTSQPRHILCQWSLFSLCLSRNTRAKVSAVCLLFISQSQGQPRYGTQEVLTIWKKKKTKKQVEKQRRESSILQGIFRGFWKFLLILTLCFPVVIDNHYDRFKKVENWDAETPATLEIAFWIFWVTYDRFLDSYGENF